MLSIPAATPLHAHFKAWPYILALQYYSGLFIYLLFWQFIFYAYAFLIPSSSSLNLFSFFCIKWTKISVSFQYFYLPASLCQNIVLEC